MVQTGRREDGENGVEMDELQCSRVSRLRLLLRKVAQVGR